MRVKDTIFWYTDASSSLVTEGPRRRKKAGLIPSSRIFRRIFSTGTGSSWHDFMVPGPRGRRGAAVSVGVFSTRHIRPGQSTGVGGGVRTSFRSRTNPRAGPTGRIVRGLRALALSALRLTITTLTKTQGQGGGASQRPSALAGPLFVCCCVGQAKVNGATVCRRECLWQISLFLTFFEKR